MKKGKLYLIPSTMGDSPVNLNVPQTNKNLILKLKYFIVENVRTARRFMKKVDKTVDIDSITFFVLDKRTKASQIPAFLKPIKSGHSIGVLSEAGCPGVADPGAVVVKLAHNNNIKVVPLVGPSSILLSLMASGLNGQNFAFNGYLPVKSGEAVAAIKELEQRSIKLHQTQLFIETPFRNTKILRDIVSACKPSTKLCIACDITLESEYIVTKTIEQWEGKIPEINKRPAIFLIQG